MKQAVFKAHHNPSGGAEVQLDDEAVSPGKEGGTSGWHQHVGVQDAGGGVQLPFFW